MANPVAQVHHIDDHGVTYDALGFTCPGCKESHGSGFHMLPVTPTSGSRPTWDWDGNLEAPTLAPSIKTSYRHPTGYTRDNPAPVGYDGPYTEEVCHSYLRAGVFEYLGDSTHSMANQFIPMVPLEDWMLT